MAGGNAKHELAAAHDNGDANLAAHFKESDRLNLHGVR
jgi:hypothetical protein